MFLTKLYYYFIHWMSGKLGMISILILVSLCNSGLCQTSDSLFINLCSDIEKVGESGDYDSTRKLCREVLNLSLSPLQEAYIQRYIFLTYLEDENRDSMNFYLDKMRQFATTIEKVDSKYATRIINDISTLTLTYNSSFDGNSYFKPFFEMTDTSTNAGKKAYADLLVGLYLLKQPYEYKNAWYDNIKQIKHAIQLLESVYGKYDTLTGDRYYDLAYAYSAISYHKLAIENYKTSLDIYIKKKNPVDHDVALLHNNIASSYSKLGLYDIALTHVRKAADIWREDPALKKYYYISISGMINYNSSLGLYKEAMVLNSELINYHSSRGDTLILIPLLLNQFYYSGESPENNPYLIKAKVLIDSVDVPQRELLRLSKYVNYYTHKIYLNTKLQPITHDKELLTKLHDYVGKMSAFYDNIDIDSRGTDLMLMRHNILYDDGKLINRVEHEIDQMELQKPNVIGLRKSYMDNIKELQQLYCLKISHHIRNDNRIQLREVVEVMEERIQMIFGEKFNWSISSINDYESNFYLAAYLAWYASAVNYLNEVDAGVNQFKIIEYFNQLKFILAYQESIQVNYRFLKPEYKYLLKLVSQINIDYLLNNQQDIPQVKGELARIMLIYSGSKNAKQFIINQFANNAELRDSFIRYQEIKSQRKLLVSRLGRVTDNSKEYNDQIIAIKGLNEDEYRLKEYLNKDRNLIYSPLSIIYSEPLDTRSIIPENKFILQYFLFSDSVYIVGIDRESNNIKKIGLSRFKALEEEFYSVFNLDSIVVNNSNSLQTTTRTVLTDFYKYLIQPVLNKADGSVTIIPDERLFNLPFHIALCEENQDGGYQNWPYMFLKYNVSYAYSWQDFLVDEIEPHTQELRVAAIGYNSSSNGITKLYGAVDESQKIAKLFNGDSYIETAMTSELLLSTMNNYNVVHIVTHGIIHDSIDKTINLLLAVEENDNHKLNISELYFQQNNQALISLSACNSGYTIDWDGELASTSIGRAFENSGVRSVVMSLWEVPDEVGNKIMIDFYTNLKTGQSKDVALASSYKEFISTNDKPHLMHPFYWSAFVVNGDIDPLVESAWVNSDSYLSYAILLLLSLIGIGIAIILYLRKRH